MIMQGSFEPVFVDNVGNLFATTQKAELEAKRKEEEPEWGEEVWEEQQNITGKYEIGCSVSISHYT